MTAVAAFTALTIGGGSAFAAVWLPTTPANWSTVVSEHKTDVGDVTRGVHLSRDVLDTVAGRQPTQTLTVDSTDANVRVGVVGAGSTLVNPADETVSSMAKRTGAVAGVNGGFFDVNASGQPIEGEIVGGEMWKSPRHSHDGTFIVRKDGSMAIHDEEFTGTITDGASSHPLYSVNWTADATGDQITEVTPRLGGPVDLSATKPTLVTGTTTNGGATITVSSIATVATLNPLPTGTAGLLASGAGAAWLTTNVHVGDALDLTSATAPDADIQQLLQGPGQPLVRDGQLPADLSTGNPSGLNPETAIGLDPTGRHLTMVTLDGRGTTATAVGPTVPQVAGYMQQLGVSNALLLDGGGSTTMVAREPGQTATTLENTPSDSTGERAVGNGILIYSTATTTGAPSTAAINGGREVTAVRGVPVEVPASASDSAGNPVPSGGVRVEVTPASLGSWANGVFTPTTAGTGTITVTDGAVTASVPITVQSALSTLTVSPSDPDLDNGRTVPLALTGTTSNGAQIPLAPTAATWSVDDPSLASVSAAGAVTAADTGSGLVNVTASVGGAKAVSHVAVGNTSTELAPMDDSADWTYGIKNGATATVSTATDGPPRSEHTSSIRLDYQMPGTPGVHQMVISPKKPITIDNDASGKAPTSIGIWINDQDTVHDAFQFAVSYKQGNGQSATLYNTGVQYGGWSLLKTPIPAGSVFPLTLSWVDMLSINPTKASSGSLELSSLQTLYSARPASAPQYTAIPQNPTWLQYVGSPAQFTPGGQTILMGDDAHMLASDPGGASSNVMDQIAARVQGTTTISNAGQPVAPLPGVAKPTLVQMLGDMSDDGKAPDLAYAKRKIAAIGVPFHDLVGNHEITQGADAENGNFDSAFGDTHYAYSAGAATVIATDSAHTSITGSDAFQTPAEQQYPWLVKELDQATTPVIIVATHMPAYDPFPAKNSQFSDRWEAQQYMTIVQHYRESHPDKHVVMTYGHARGFSEQILNPTGASTIDGIPQFVFADLGMPAYTTPNQGGFYHFGLVHITDAGQIQFAVEPVLESLAVSAGSAASTPASPSHVTVGHTITLTAQGRNQTGDNLDPVTVPIQAPASHVWSSANPNVASVNPDNGIVTARAPGSTTVTVEAGGLTASHRIVVAAPPAAPTPAPSSPSTAPTAAPSPAGTPSATTPPGHATGEGSAGSGSAHGGSSGPRGVLAFTGSVGLPFAAVIAAGLIISGLIIARRRRAARR